MDDKDIVALLREELSRRDGIVTIRDIARAADEIERLRGELSAARGNAEMAYNEYLKVLGHQGGKLVGSPPGTTEVKGFFGF